MENSISDKLLLKFFEKQTTPSENGEIYQWIEASEANKQEFRKQHETYLFSQIKNFNSDIDLDEAWRKMEKLVSGNKKKTFIPQMDIFWKIAASVIIILSFGLGFYQIKYSSKQQLAKSNIVVEAPTGEKSKVVLADGTVVWLNAESNIRYNPINPRQVHISGEAYFDVTKDKKHPFEVITEAGVKVTVLGTRFNLRSFANESYVQTTLEEGSVKITYKDYHDELVLKPNEQASFDLNSKSIAVKKVVASEFSEWRNNKLSFENIGFAELIPRIERWYGVKIELGSNLNTHDRFTLTVKTESLRELLEMMKLTSNFEYEIIGNQVKLQMK